MRYLTGAPIAALGVPIPASPLPLADSWRALHPTAKDAATYHGWGNPYASPHRIDYILATIRPLAAAIHAIPAPFPSDHHPVTALLEL